MSKSVPLPVTTIAMDVAQYMNAHRLPAQTLLIEQTPDDIATGSPSISVGLGENYADLPAWAGYLGVSLVRIERRKEEVIITLEAIRDGMAWRVVSSYPKSLSSGFRERVPGIVVKYDRREIGGSIMSRGTITTDQLNTLVGELKKRSRG